MRESKDPFNLMAFALHLLIFFSIFSIVVIGLNLLAGYTGLLSLAQAGFYGIGAYAAALLMTVYHVPFWIALICAIAITMLVAAIIGIILSPFRGDYYAITSAGFSVIIYGILLNWNSFTRGPLGIPSIPRPVGFNSTAAYAALVVIALALVYGLSSLIVRSSFGRVLKAIREDQDALRVFGYNINAYKIAVFVIAAGISAVAGVLYGSYIRFIDPSAFIVTESVYFIAAAILGGLGNLRGSLLGAVLFFALFEAVRFLGFPPDIVGYMRLAIVGVLLVVLMLYRPRGLIGEYSI